MATLSRRTFARAFRTDRNGRQTERGPVHGTARKGKRTKDLVKRLDSGDVAVIDHRNLDRIAAEELVASGVRAVINLSPSSDGSYPNVGPLTLVRAGVPLVDVEDPALFERLRDGDPLVLDGGSVRIAGEVVAEGRLLEADELARELDEQRRRIDRALHDFTENTMAHIREEGALLSGTIDFPETLTTFRDRHALIVVRGTDHVKDLRALRAYIHDVRPVLVGVDGGGDAILKEGLTPDVVLGDMDSASAKTLRSGAELIVHAYPDGTAPGADRLRELGLDYTVVPAAGTSQDVAAGGRDAGGRQGRQPALQPRARVHADGPLLRGCSAAVGRRRPDYPGAAGPVRPAVAEDQGPPWAIARATTRPRWWPCSSRSPSAS